MEIKVSVRSNESVQPGRNQLIGDWVFSEERVHDKLFTSRYNSVWAILIPKNRWSIRGRKEFPIRRLSWTFNKPRMGAGKTRILAENKIIGLRSPGWKIALNGKRLNPPNGRMEMEVVTILLKGQIMVAMIRCSGHFYLCHPNLRWKSSKPLILWDECERISGKYKRLSRNNPSASSIFNNYRTNKICIAQFRFNTLHQH